MIRPVEEQDLEHCVQVIVNSFLTVAKELGLTAQNAPRFTAFATTRERLAARLDQGWPLFLWEEEGKPVGFYSLALPPGSRDCELNNLAVLPAYRHRGLGGRLLAHSVEIARQKGQNRMCLGIVEENRRLRAWYEAAGFVHTGVKKFDFFPFTCGYMEKRLG